MEKAIIAFSFDDGRLDNYTNAYPILKKYHLPATFNITSGYIKGNIDREKFDFPEPMTIDMVREIFNDPLFEIAGHGNQHINTKDDIVSGIKDLQELLNTENLNSEANGFASPGSDLTEEMYRNMKSALTSNHINYVRISCRYRSFKMFKVLFRKISRIIKWPWIYKTAYQDTLMSEVNDGILYSIPVLSSVTPEQLKAIIGLAVKEKQACVLMLHSIVAQEEMRNTWDYRKDHFERLCKILSDYQKSNLLEVKTTMGLYLSLRK